jgi:hypothetical protein
MTTECYYDRCIYHASQLGDDGPFCDEEICLASKKDLEEFEKLRQNYLRAIGFIKDKRDV